MENIIIKDLFNEDTTISIQEHRGKYILSVDDNREGSENHGSMIITKEQLKDLSKQINELIN